MASIYSFKIVLAIVRTIMGNWLLQFEWDKMGVCMVNFVIERCLDVTHLLWLNFDYDTYKLYLGWSLITVSRVDLIGPIHLTPRKKLSEVVRVWTLAHVADSALKLALRGQLHLHLFIHLLMQWIRAAARLCQSKSVRLGTKKLVGRWCGEAGIQAPQ